MKLLIILTLLIQTAFAGDVTHLTKGSPAPYEGYLFTPEKEREVRLGLDTLDYYKRRQKTVSELLQDIESKEKVMNDRIKLKDQQIDTLSKRLVDAKDDSFLSKAGFFLLGAILTGGIAFGLSRTLSR